MDQAHTVGLDQSVKNITGNGRNDNGCIGDVLFEDELLLQMNHSKDRISQGTFNINVLMSS